MAVLNNNQVNTLLNDVYNMMVGDVPTDSTIDLQSFVDTGNDPTLPTFVEQFTKSLIVAGMKRWFTDSSYRSEYKDPFFQEEGRYRAITQMVTIEVPEVQESHAWKDFSSTSPRPQVGTYTLFLPIVHAQYYGKTVSWELPIAITYEQWDDAVESREGLDELINYIMLCVDNKITMHLEDCSALNRNNFIAEKIAYAESDDAVGVHVLNLVEEYVKYKGIESTGMTREAFLSNKDALVYAMSRVKLYIDYMKKKSKLFNTAGYVRFTPNERMVVQMLTAFTSLYDTVAQSEIFHNDITALPNYQSIPVWQMETNESGDSLTFDVASSIDVEISSDGTAIKRDGIVGFIADQWAIIHTIKNQRVAVTTHDPEAVRQYYNQFRDSYMNNLTMNALVLVVDDVAAAEVSV